VTAFLGQIRGREIDRDVPEGECEADSVQGIANPLPTLGHGLVGEADDREDVPAATDADLHLDGACFDPDERERGNLPVHEPAPNAAAPPLEQYSEAKARTHSRSRTI